MDTQTLTAVSGRTVWDVLADGARTHPGRTLLVVEDRDGSVSNLSWSQVVDRSTVLAALLEGEGISKGDYLHVHLPNRFEFLVVLFAAARLGAVIVPTNTNASVDELAFIIEHSKSRLSLVDSVGSETVVAAREVAGHGGTILICEELDLLAQASRSVAGNAVDASDNLAVMYTSGTTSRPKGVQVTHANYLWAGEVVSDALRLTPEDRVLTVLPLFHANAQFYTVMSALVTGATIVLLPSFSASGFLGQVAHHRVTVASLFAAPIRMILAKSDKYAGPQPKNLRAVLYAQNLSERDLDRWEQLVGVPLFQLYGMTETIAPPVFTPLSGHPPLHAIGRVVPGYVCRVEREDGTAAGEGDSGQLLVRGEPGITLMRGYLHDPEATQKSMKDGWLYTGDVVRIEPRGYLSFVDRQGDMIKRSGENIASTEVEAAISMHPSVEDVAVFGIPDEFFDEEVVAAVVPRDGAILTVEEIATWCVDHLAKFRVPGRIIIVDSLPRTAVGKIQKGVLRQHLAVGESPA